MNKKIACTFIISPQKMQETKDSSIKLFGRNISLQAEGHCPVIDAEKGGGGGEDEGRQRKGQDVEADKESQNGKVKESPEEKEAEETAKYSKNKDGTNSQEKILKKPEQVLPCPRCDSDNTKFCYYNNYNINQPRHFCKSCQRYWTKGGTMRNVPVGSGRRKTKNHSSHYPYITINEALRVAKFSAPNNGTNGKVLNFESDSYMGSVLNLSENKIVSKSTKYPCSIEEIKKNTLQFPCVTWSSNIPMFPSKMSSPNLNYPILGKNGRDGDMVEVCRQRNGSVLVPKTLRIDDPSEVAMSSIWKTLGLENGSLKSGSMFEAFQSCKGGKNQKHQRDETCSVFMANPAALSRSFHFHENT